MKKKLILLLILLIISAPFFIPVTLQETVPVKAPLLNVFSLLLSPNKWQRWRPDLKKIAAKDGNKLIVKKDSGSFVISHESDELDVRFANGIFYIKDGFGNGNARYTYTVAADKNYKTAFVTVSKKLNVVSYLASKLTGFSFGDTHVDDLKHFFETDSLHYGYRIFKTGVPESNLIEVKREVLTKDRFTQAAKMLAEMQDFVKKQGVKQMHPLIAQFLAVRKDSTQVNIGFFINKEVKSNGDVTFTRMPKGGPLYAAQFKGKFNRRQSVYEGLHEYYFDHGYQLPMRPFEMYLDNKLPTSDTDKVNIQVNFMAYL